MKLKKYRRPHSRGPRLDISGAIHYNKNVNIYGSTSVHSPKMAVLDHNDRMLSVSYSPPAPGHFYCISSSNRRQTRHTRSVCKRLYAISKATGMSTKCRIAGVRSTEQSVAYTVCGILHDMDVYLRCFRQLFRHALSQSSDRLRVKLRNSRLAQMHDIRNLIHIQFIRIIQGDDHLFLFGQTVDR